MINLNDQIMTSDKHDLEFIGLTNPDGQLFVNGKELTHDNGEFKIDLELKSKNTNFEIRVVTKKGKSLFIKKTILFPKTG